MTLRKVVNNHADIAHDQFLSPALSKTRSNHSLKFRQILARTNVWKFIFFARTVLLWNL